MDISGNNFELESSALAEENANENAKRKTLVAPWKNVEEFRKVYYYIYGPQATDDTKRLACRKMIIWKLRRVHLTPAAVLATLVILEIQLKDSQRDSSNIEKLKELQILYSSAFTRFFNYMSSIMQTQNMKTMYETAKELNLLSFVVDLRHICAHGQTMPSIEILRSTSKYCLRWLENFYWKPQSECMQNVDTSNIRRIDKSQFEDNVVQLFGFFDAALECVIKEEQTIVKKYVKGEKYAAMKAYSDNKKVIDATQLLLEIVKDLGNLLKQEKNMTDLSEVYIAAFLKMRFFFKLVEKHARTDEELNRVIRHTQGLFRVLAIYGLIEDLFHSLLAIIENKNEEVSRRKSAAFWAHQIVLGFIAFRRCKEIYKQEREKNLQKKYDLSSLNFNNTSKKVLKFYSKVGINIKKTLIFGDTVRRPWVWTFSREFIQERVQSVSEYSVEILKNALYLVDPQFSEKEIKTLQVLLDLNISNNLSRDYGEAQCDADNCDIVYTADDILRYIGSSTDRAKKDSDGDIQQYGVWSTAPDCQEWYTCPIGKLIWD